MEYIDEFGVKYSEDRKTLVKCPENLTGEYIIPPEVEAIEKEAFYKSKLSSIHVADSITRIGELAFACCGQLQTINLPVGIRIIPSRLFLCCPALKEIRIPDGVISIGCRAFEECTNLTYVHIPSGVTVIKAGAFYGCSSLEKVELPGTLALLEPRRPSPAENYFYLADSGAFSFCTSLKSIVIPGSVSLVGEYAFAGCKKLSSVTIINAATDIEGNAFDGCPLSEIHVPENQDKRFYYMECFHKFRPLLHKTYKRNKLIRSIVFAILWMVDVVFLYFVGKAILYEAAFLFTSMVAAPFMLPFIENPPEMWFPAIFMFILGIIAILLDGIFMFIIAGLPLFWGDTISNSILKEDVTIKNLHLLILISSAILVGFGIILGCNIANYDTQDLILAIISVVVAAITPIMGYGLAESRSK